MRKLSILLAFTFLCTIAANAQEFKKFKVGVGVGYAMPGGKGAKGGILAYFEPAYRVTDAIQLGLRCEAAIIARGSATDTEIDLDVAGLGSYTLNGQYYFNNNGFRPFVGAGFGIYTIAGESIEVSGGGASATVEIAAVSKFGVYPRVGFDAGHFTLSLDYNIVPDTDNIKNSYLGIRLGGFFGGGRK